MSSKFDIVIVGAGFTGLTAGYELSKKGKKVCILEKDDTVGGLAGIFTFEDGVKVEKYYHHWFNSDKYVMKLIEELDLANDVIVAPTNTGMYFNGRLWKLSSPLDLLRFKPLRIIDRCRLGFLLFQVRRVKDWKSIEHLSIREWLEPLCGSSVYRIVWEPLVNAKFSNFAEVISAVWMWKKLVLRGNTRNKKGGEELSYLKGGFGRLADKLVEEIHQNGGKVSLGIKVTGVKTNKNMISSVKTNFGTVEASNYLFTPSFPIIAEILGDEAETKWIESLKRVKYLGNMCLTLRLKQSLSDTYWLNVNDPSFPFVGVIEHTNFDAPKNYKGTHIVYLSRYLSVEEPVWNYSDEEYLHFAVVHLNRMFPKFASDWVIDYKVWRAQYAQPVTEKNYSMYVPGQKTPFGNGLISTMAQIYPEDRGTNYAVREGRNIANKILAIMKN